MEGEAVTTTGWTSKTTIRSPTPAGISWELDRTPSNSLPERCAVVGGGRLGHALAAALRDAGLSVDGPLGRRADPTDADVVLLTVPDGEIANAAAALTPVDEQLVGHCSGATTSTSSAPARRSASIRL